MSISKSDLDKIRKAMEPFARVALMNGKLPANLQARDDAPIRGIVPGAWPVMGDLRRCLECLNEMCPEWKDADADG